MKVKEIEAKPAKPRANKVRVTMSKAEARRLAAAIEALYWHEHGEDNEVFLHKLHEALSLASSGTTWVSHATQGFKRAKAAVR